MALDGIDHELAQRAEAAVVNALAEETPTIGRLLSITRDKVDDDRADFVDVDGFQNFVQITHRIIYLRREEDQGQ